MGRTWAIHALVTAVCLLLQWCVVASSSAFGRQQGVPVSLTDAGVGSDAPPVCRLHRSNHALLRCCTMALVHRVYIGKSWGDLRPGEQRVWAQLNCDRYAWEIDIASWRREHNGAMPPPRPAVHTAVGERRRVTVVIATFRQPKCLQRQVDLWQRCPLVHSIRINWFDGNGDVLPTWSRDEAHANVIIDKLPNRLSYRFKPRDFATTAIFSVDVDMLYSCAALKHAYRLWLAHPRSMVGFHARRVHHGFRAWAGDAWAKSYRGPQFKRNLILVTKGGIQHRDAFEAYFRDEYRALRERADAALQGEDYLMSFVHARHFDPVVQFVCLGYEEMCQYDCQEGASAEKKRRKKKKISLSARTGSQRGKVLNAIYDALGDPLVQLHGSINMTWFGLSRSREAGSFRADRGRHFDCRSSVLYPWNEYRQDRGGGCTQSFELVHPKVHAETQFSSKFHRSYSEGRLTATATGYALAQSTL